MSSSSAAAHRAAKGGIDFEDSKYDKPAGGSTLVSAFGGLSANDFGRR